jgi:putative ATP-dependent endonuclease of OLD family
VGAGHAFARLLFAGRDTGAQAHEAARLATFAAGSASLTDVRLSSIKVQNFRNLRDVQVPLRPGTVIVGENASGKSNLLYALRLALDPSLPSSERRLRAEDFSDTLGEGDAAYDPLAAGAEIVIAVEFEDIGSDAKTLALLGSSLIETDPLKARVVYRFAPRDSAESTSGRPAYDWKILGGPEEAEEEVRGDLRRFLRVTVLSALRNVEGDIAYWRRSPLRPLLEAAAAEIDDDALNAVAQSVTAANSEVLDLEPIKKLTEAITARTTELVGEERASPTSFGVAPSDPQRLLRTLQLFVDDASRPLSSASLGALNILYLALLQLSLDEEVRASEAAHIVLGIEEPEAHLHPHAQRLVFADVLRQPPGREQSVIVTTHSPHIVSVTPPRNLIVLRSTGGEVQAGVAAEAALSAVEWDDIGRYLDATRGELVFARRVLLVEGFAEAVLVPKLAADAGIDLDKAGVSVCAIHGTHFRAYARYLSALGTPWALITDGDPGEGVSAGESRARKLLESLGLEGDAAEHGIFVGADTFESDIASHSERNGKIAAEVMATWKWGTANAGLIAGWKEHGVSDMQAYMTCVDTVGKGRFAQRLAGTTGSLAAPGYVAGALAYLIG